MFPVSHDTNSNFNYLLLPSIFSNTSEGSGAVIGELYSSSMPTYRISDISPTDNNLERIVDLSELIDYKFNLIKPLTVKIIRENLDFIGEISNLEIHAFGDSEIEVLREVNRDVTELFEELFDLDENQLGTKPSKWKKILSEHIQKNLD